MASPTCLADVKKGLVSKAVSVKSSEEKASFFERLLDGEMKAEDFPEISIDFLSMKKEVGGHVVPTFAVFDITQKPDDEKSYFCHLEIVAEFDNCDDKFEVDFQLSLDGERPRQNDQLYLQYSKTMFAEPLAACFALSVQAAKLGEDDKYHQEHRDSYPLSRIPKRLVALLKEEREIFDQILLVKEAAWEVKKGEKPAPDPLIIGRKGEKFFLLHVFDETIIEHYVSKEFKK